MNELILKKRAGKALEKEEIDWMVDGFTKGDVPDYQMSAMLMAICFQGMDERETLDLTLAMRDSGDVMNLEGIPGVTADKHSTGGVGDKTSLVLLPMLAACGVKMAKMSGRGLGHTGGTIDKLESFPGFSVELSRTRFFEIVNTVGFAIAGQTGNLCPADKRMYALRDVTGTVSSQALITGSIMCKKLAANADVIVLDVKTGSGAFMQTDEEAFSLADCMVKVGRAAGKKVVALVTEMDEPLGHAVGNALEVKEAVDALNGHGPADLMELCYALGTQILLEAGLAKNERTAQEMLKKSIDDKTALECFRRFVHAQGGVAAAVDDLSLLPAAPVIMGALSPKSGWLCRIDAESVGRICLGLGGGRETKDSEIDLSVGVVLNKKVGDKVKAGEPLALIHAADEKSAAAAARKLVECCEIGETAPEKRPFIRGVVK